ncbi:dTMP kinase [Paenibacillus sp. N1-5-1-14]|uniref:dTMP kinase n=1 Tax=Paenibacillus radicibacter TaxID=2972488 RepID=UPI0021597456|nr:dTMP kinase [Paenibacillus radicibacter]MCR8641440.1 dTMP kinase [Paenibacillus radicibacter]
MVKIKIVVISGLDKSGKHTQANMLTARLESDGYRVVKSEFHRYDTETGKLIRKWLNREWDVNQISIELLMACDKQAQQEWINELEMEGVDLLILDRYILDQEVYASANGADTKWVKELQRYMRQPDINIIIDIPSEVSMARKGKHNNGDNDRYESDKEMLDAVRKYYSDYSNNNKNTTIYIDGMQSIEDIHSELFDKLVQMGVVKI